MSADPSATFSELAAAAPKPKRAPAKKAAKAETDTPPAAKKVAAKKAATKKQPSKFESFYGCCCFQ